jgi:hypothetical protein
MRVRSVLNVCLVAALVYSCSGGGSASEDAVADGPAAADAKDLAAVDADAAALDALLPDAGDAGLDAAKDAAVAPTYWSPEATQTVDDIVFVPVDGKPFFSIGIHAGAGLTYDGVTGPGECDKSEGVGYLDINIGKTHAAAAAGANLVFLWGYDSKTDDLLDVQPRFKGRFHHGYGIDIPKEQDVVPVFYNEFGEVDLDGFDPADVEKMKQHMKDFLDRTGPFSPESMPNLPPLEQVGFSAWHPTWRMIGSETGEGEMLSDAEADALAKALNMMIGDTYTYVENRFDWNVAGEAIMAAAVGQKGDKGEGYDDWLATDDPDHRSMFTSGFELTHSLATRRNPGAVVWMWVQGYAFKHSIDQSACLGDTDDSWATGDFPTPRYLRKEIAGMIAAGATGIIFFGFPSTLPEEAEVLNDVFRALSHPEVYGPALLSPRLDLGFDTLFMGQEGYDGKGRAHLVVKWDEETRTATLIGANPGARETTVDIPFPWTLAKAEILDWETQQYSETPDIQLADRTLHYTFPMDEGVIIRVTPLMAE